MRDHWRGGQPLSATSWLVEHRKAAAQLRLNKRNNDLTRHTWSTKKTANTFNAYMALSENRLTHGNPTWHALFSTVKLPQKLGPSPILRPTNPPLCKIVACSFRRSSASQASLNNLASSNPMKKIPTLILKPPTRVGKIQHDLCILDVYRIYKD